jgi:tetratricopeptide (TPR) repeat protein
MIPHRTSSYQFVIISILFCFSFFTLLANKTAAQSRNELNRIYKAATNYERIGQYDRAVEHFYTLFRALPASASYYNGLKRNLQRLGRYEEMIQVVRQRLSVIDDIVGRADLGDALYKNRREAEGKKVWEELLQRYKTSSGAYSQVASAMLRNNLTDDAVAIYSRGREVLNNPALFAIELANAYAARLQYDLATHEFLLYLDRNPKQLVYVQQRILSLFNEDSGSLILQEVENYIQKNTAASFELLQIKANCLKRLERFEEALLVHAQLESLKPASAKSNPNGRELFNFANEMLRANQVNVAIAAYRQLISHWPDSPYYPAAQLGLAEALVQSEQYNDALTSLDEMISAKKNANYILRAYLLKGEIYLSHLNQPQQALEVYSQIQKLFRQPQAQKESALALGDVYFRLGDMRLAEQWYLNAYRLLSTKETGYRNTVHFKLAELAFCKKDFRQAIEALDKIEQAPMVKSEENDLYNDALEFIFLVEQNLADSTTALTLFAEANCRQKKHDFSAAVDSLLALENRYPKSLLAPKALLDAGGIYGLLSLPEKKIEAYARAASQYSASIYADEANFLLAKAYEETGQIENAIST